MPKLTWIPRRVPCSCWVTFGDLEGKLDVLRVECTRWQRKGRYSVAKLIAKYGRRANMMKWKEQLNGDCRSGTRTSCTSLRSDLPRPAEGALMIGLL
jgi:hypothetical protein